MSVTMRTAGAGGQIHSFCAVNSLSLAFCIGPAEAREHAHRPQPPAVHRRVHAAGERVLPGLAEAVFVASRDVVGRIERLEGDARERLESHGALFPLTFLTHLSTSRAMTSFWICDVPS